MAVRLQSDKKNKLFARFRGEGKGGRGGGGEVRYVYVCEVSNLTVIVV